MSTITYHTIGEGGYKKGSDWFSEEEEPELSDEELALANEGQPWLPEPELFEDFSFMDQKLRLLEPIPPILPSQFTEFAFRMPQRDAQRGYAAFDFTPRRHMRRLYDSPAKRVLLFCARQTEKSTLVGNRLLTYSCMIPSYRSLYVSPSATQTKTFSVDRVKEPLETSEVLRAYTTTLLQQNVFEKQFINRSKITLRYAFLNADRCRGIPANAIVIDEFQDILSDCVPVIEQAASHSPEDLKRFIYAGTPKGLDNVLEYYRSGTSRGKAMSTMGEWVVPCERHGGEGGRFWNILGEKNIEKKGLSCEKCHQPIDPMHPDAQWAMLQDEGVFESYRIPQLMVPWKAWEEVYLDYGRYDRAKFYNEVLGISYDSGLRPLTRVQLKACCRPDISMHSSELEKYKVRSAANNIFAGLDWGCYSEDTRTLTDRGWLYHWEVTEEDRVAQWDPHTEEISYVKPKKKIVFDYVGDMIHFQSKTQDILVTPDHKKYYRTGSRKASPWHEGQAQDLVGLDNVRFPSLGTWVGLERQVFCVAGEVLAMHLWLQFLGLVISEGCVTLTGKNKTTPHVSLAQRRPDGVSFIDCLLAQLPFEYSKKSALHPDGAKDFTWYFLGEKKVALHAWFIRHVGGKAATKRIPREFLELSPRLLRYLFDALMLGDGTRDKRDPMRGSYTSTSEGLADDFLELATKLQLRAVKAVHREAKGNRRKQWRVSFSARNREPSVHSRTGGIQKVPYKGKCFCFSVSSGYFVTERNGRVALSGNTGENSYTVLTLGTYVDDRFRIFYVHRFIGEDVDPVPQMEKIDEILSYLNVRVIGADYGGGFHSNDHLVRKFGFKRVQKYQYLSRARKKLLWNPAFRRWQIVRTELMSDVFNAIKRKQIDLPRWEEFEDPYANDCLNIYAEYNETVRMLQYRHRPDRPDDTFHSILYCLLASMIVFPRPDIINPQREFEGQGPLRSSYRGPIDQG